jgi:hypothetical protein
MKRLFATAFLAASALAAPAFAQDAPPAHGGATATTDPGLTASTGAAADFETVLAAIRAGKTNVGAIDSMSSVSEVEVVRITDLVGGTDAQALETAVAENQADIEALQKAIEGNMALKAELDANSVAVSDIVAANVEADGSLTVFAR